MLQNNFRRQNKLLLFIKLACLITSKITFIVFFCVDRHRPCRQSPTYLSYIDVHDMVVSFMILLNLVPAEGCLISVVVSPPLSARSSSPFWATSARYCASTWEASALSMAAVARRCGGSASSSPPISSLTTCS